MNHVLYITSSHPNWVDLATRLSTQDVGHPVLWTGDEDLHSTVRDSFPHCEVWDRFDAFECERELTAADDSFHAYFRMISHASWPQFYWDANHLLTRYDSSYQLAWVDREYLIHKCLLFWIDRVISLRLDSIVASETPHTCSDYLAYRAAEFLGCNAAVFEQCTVAPVMWLRPSISEPVARRWSSGIQQKATVDLLIAEARTKLDAIHSSPADYVSRARGTKRMSGTDLTPNLALENRALAAIKKTRASARLASVIRRRRIKRRDIRLLPSHSGSHDRSLLPDKYRLGSQRYEYIVSQIARELSSATTEDFVLFARHYQPERTSVPAGGAFGNVLTALTTTRSYVPSEIPILARIHPTQVHSLSGLAFESLHWRSFTKMLPNVEFTGPQVPMKRLVSRAQLVVTVTGTVALEAAMLGVPVLALGVAWYAGLPGTLNYASGSDFKQVRKINNSNVESTEEFVFDLIKDGVPGIQNLSGTRCFPQVVENSEAVALQSVSVANRFAADDSQR